MAEENVKLKYVASFVKKYKNNSRGQNAALPMRAFTI